MFDPLFCGLSILSLLWSMEGKWWATDHTVGVKNCVSRRCVFVWLLIKWLQLYMWVFSICQLYHDTHMLTKLKFYEYVTCTIQWKKCPGSRCWCFALTKCSQKEWIWWFNLLLLEYGFKINHKTLCARWWLIQWISTDKEFKEVWGHVCSCSDAVKTLWEKSTVLYKWHVMKCHIYI